MPITLLDGILIGFTLVSALLAMVRGFSREILSIASWIAAAAAAYFLYPVALPYLTPYIDNEKLALAASAALVFVIALILVTIITMKIADFIIDSRVGALDRTLGFLYGAARGILVVAVALLFFNWLVGANPPAWVTYAKSRPMLENIGAKIEAMLPSDPDTSIIDRIRGHEDEATPAPEVPAEPSANDAVPPFDASPESDTAPEGEPAQN
ncbi:CvpA family protein [Tianweitania sp. BSSL-BM11]|uniref:CvpA family protein n=1 Tax=Tianweitania aestuarii TaxID=2814886 RepID=A0ABS5RSJ2_9HYPH|nr:CvpA family protein [Tianweitania aestuarii]MBS9719981.1 CvpA family protein [Tianweitania aestuarii]